MSDNDDLELQALQRQLDDAFETTRPRVGFEDELWSRMQARRPLWRRVREFVAALADSIREAPAVPAAAVAVVLIVAVGVGIVSLSGLHFGGGGSTATSQSGGAQYNASRAPGAADLGHLPAVGLYPGVPAPHVKGTPFPDTAQPGAIPIPDNLYFGPATLAGPATSMLLLGALWSTATRSQPQARPISLHSHSELHLRPMTPVTSGHTRVSASRSP